MQIPNRNNIFEIFSSNTMKLDVLLFLLIFKIINAAAVSVLEPLCSTSKNILLSFPLTDIFVNYLITKTQREISTLKNAFVFNGILLFLGYCCRYHCDVFCFIAVLIYYFYFVHANLSFLLLLLFICFINIQLCDLYQAQTG